MRNKVTFYFCKSYYRDISTRPVYPVSHILTFIALFKHLLKIFQPISLWLQEKLAHVLKTGHKSLKVESCRRSG